MTEPNPYHPPAASRRKLPLSYLRVYIAVASALALGGALSVGYLSWFVLDTGEPAWRHDTWQWTLLDGLGVMLPFLANGALPAGAIVFENNKYAAKMAASGIILFLGEALVVVLATIRIGY